MAISLRKGDRISLSKGLEKVRACLGWDTNKYDGGSDFDLDASVFMLGANGKVTSDQDFIFYNQKTHPSGCIEHMGDNRTGDGEGDDEVINLELGKVPQEIQRIVFTVTIHEAEARRQNFGQVSNSYIRIVDSTNENEVMRFDLGEDFSQETSVCAGELYRHNNEWKFKAVGQGYNRGLAGFCADFGIDAM
ncbi:MAG: TerD family protein [Candidatus Bruticola sp.]